MTTGLYLYCLREPAAAPPDTCSTPRVARGESGGIHAAAVDGKAGVTTRVFEGVEAVVSAVNPDDYWEMQRKAREDVHWIRDKALIHERVVEEAMGIFRDVESPSRETLDKLVYHADGVVGDRSACGGEDGHARARPLHSVPVIPFKFGVIFNDEARLAKVIAAQSAAIQAVFGRIRGKQEWSVKLFLKDSGTFKAQVKEESDTLRRKSKALAALPAGRAYFMEEELTEELERECTRKLDEEALQTFEALNPFAEEAVRVKLLDRKLTGRNERMVLNSAYLVANRQRPEFDGAVSDMRGTFAARGFLLEQSGPWPPYHFAEFAHA